MISGTENTLALAGFLGSPIRRCRKDIPVRKQLHIRTLLFLTLVSGVVSALVGPDLYRRLRFASVCYVLGDVASPGRMETLGRRLTVRGAIRAAGGLTLNFGRANIRLVRPGSAGGVEQCVTVDLSNPTTDYVMKPKDRLIIYRDGTN